MKRFLIAVVILTLTGVRLIKGDSEEDDEKGAMEQILDVNTHLGTESSESPETTPKLFQGDVMLDPQQTLNLHLFGDVNGPNKVKRSASKLDETLWPGAVIPYKLDCSIKNLPLALDALYLAMKEWESRTCIRFVERTTERVYLTVFRAVGCWCHVGYRSRGRRYLSIGNGCEYKHVMVHELGHAIGFWHEQSRYDRDDYVEVLWDNIIAGYEDNFEKSSNSTTSSYGVPYDYGSIMHYPFTAFSKDRSNLKTLEPKRPLNGKTPYKGLSDDDALQANRMYKCDEKNKTATVKRTARSNSQETGYYPGSTICKDFYSGCATWAQNGGCKKHASRLLAYCQKTCGSCVEGVPCQDKYSDCLSRSHKGQCTTDAWVMMKDCRVSCQTCIKDPNWTKPPTPPPTTAPTTTRPPPTEPPSTTPPPTTTPPVPTRHPNPMNLTGQRCIDKFDRCKIYKDSRCSSIWLKRNCRVKCKIPCDAQEPRPKGNCSNPLGLGWDNKLPDSAFSSSGHLQRSGWIAPASMGRLYAEDDHDKKRIAAWCVPARTPSGQYWQVNLGKVHTVTAVATQGRYLFSEHLQRYELEYSVDGQTWTKYSNDDGSVKVFQGNCDHVTPVFNTFEAIQAQYIRIYPDMDQKQYPCLRAELYGC